MELLIEKAPDDSLVIRAWVTGHMYQKESSQLNWPAPCLVQTSVLVHVDGTYIGQMIITYDNQKSERAYWFHRNSR